eukprot:2604556-Prymnesium_polylepis.1
MVGVSLTRNSYGNFYTAHNAQDTQPTGSGPREGVGLWWSCGVQLPMRALVALWCRTAVELTP